MPKLRGEFPSKSRFIWLRPKKDAGASGASSPVDFMYALVAIKVENSNGKAPFSGDIISDARVEYEQGQATPHIA